MYNCMPEKSTIGWLWVIMWVLGIKLRTSGRAASALNLQVTSPALTSPHFFRKDLSLNLECSVWAGVASQQAPGIHLSPQPPALELQAHARTIYFVLNVYMHLCVYLWICTHECSCLWREEAPDLQMLVSLLMWVLGIKFSSSRNALYCWAINLAPPLF